MSVWCVVVGGYHYGNKREKGGNNAGSTKKQQFECAKKQKIQKAERIRKCRIDANAVRGVWVEDW